MQADYTGTNILYQCRSTIPGQTYYISANVLYPLDAIYQCECTMSVQTYYTGADVLFRCGCTIPVRMYYYQCRCTIPVQTYYTGPDVTFNTIRWHNNNNNYYNGARHEQITSRQLSGLISSPDVGLSWHDYSYTYIHHSMRHSLYTRV